MSFSWSRVNGPQLVILRAVVHQFALGVNGPQLALRVGGLQLVLWVDVHQLAPTVHGPQLVLRVDGPQLVLKSKVLKSSAESNGG